MGMGGDAADAASLHSRWIVVRTKHLPSPNAKQYHAGGKDRASDNHDQQGLRLPHHEEPNEFDDDKRGQRPETQRGKTSQLPPLSCWLTGRVHE